MTQHDSPTTDTAPGRSDFDLVFVGAGVSTSYTLLGLLELVENDPLPQPLRVGIVERSTDAFSGVPYGRRAAHASLLITSLHDFLPDTERALFARWLTRNKAAIVDNLKTSGGSRSARWIAANGASIERDEWDRLYLPRSLFGDYMRERVGCAIERATYRGLATCDVLRCEVTNIGHDGHRYLLDTEPHPRAMTADRIVFAVGAAPNRARLAPSTECDAAGIRLIDDPYDPGLGEMLDQVARAVTANGAEATDMLLIGGNATTMDVLYTLVDRLDTTAPNTRFHVMAPQGVLPGRLDPEPPQLSAFVPTSLLRLCVRGSVTARSIFDAAREDIAAAQKVGMGIGDTLGPVSDAVGQLVNSLEPVEKAEFVRTHGVELGRLQRRAGHEYSDVVNDLLSTARLTIVKGRFRSITFADKRGTTVTYEDGGSDHTLVIRPSVVINCAGFASIGDMAHDTLLRRVTENGLCHPTPSGAGVVVNDDFEAHTGFYVMGPLLAGNVIGDIAVWHMEHCGRISTFSRTLAGIIAQRLRGACAISTTVQL